MIRNNAYAAKSKSAGFMPYAGETRAIKRDVNPYGAKTPLGVFFHLLRNGLILRTNPSYAAITEGKFEGDLAYNVAAGNTGSEIEAKPIVAPSLHESPQARLAKSSITGSIGSLIQTTNHLQ